MNGAVSAAKQRAMEHLRAGDPDLTVTNATLRAAEPARYVFAVFHHGLGPPSVPGRYTLVAVCRDGEVVTALDTRPDSPYWIGGRK